MRIYCIAKLAKIKIFNDPVYGFVRIPRDIIFQLIEHPYFQRLRHIKQLGLTHLVYPGALHTRFHHALGALHLVQNSIEELRIKGVPISEDESEAVSIAVLLHDIGHGPFSHALEEVFIKDISHEEISLAFMQRLNEKFNGKLGLAIDIFKGSYPRKFLNQLVASQLDVDRLDYLLRDSFYTGVSEGIIGADRIIKMMDVRNNELVIEAKGIYSIEKFLLARRLMYWQVYLHKTVVSAEQMLIRILKRAAELSLKGELLFATPAFSYFLSSEINKNDFLSNSKVLDTFALLDDHDVMTSIKVWRTHPDMILSSLCNKMINRDLFKIEFTNTAPEQDKTAILRQQASEMYGLPIDSTSYFVFSDKVENSAYSSESVKINILLKNETILDISAISDQYDLNTLTKKVTKYFLCYPKELIRKPEKE